MKDESEQASMPEVILVLDKLHDKLYGLKGLCPKDGSLELLEDVAGNLESLRRFTRGENSSEAFFRDFLTLSPEPLRYAFFKMATPSPLRFMEALEGMLSDPQLYAGLIQEHMEPLEKYLHMLPFKVRQRLSCLEWDRIKVLPLDGGTVSGYVAPPLQSLEPVSLEQLDSESIKDAWGIDLRKLPQEVLERLLRFHATPLMWLYPKVQGVRFPLLASISLLRLPGGDFTLHIHCIRSVDALDKVRGFLIGDKERRELRLRGQMSRPQDMRNPETMEVEPTLLGLDPLTLEPRLLPRSGMRLPDVFMTHELTLREKERLLDGEHVTMRLESGKGHGFEAGVFLSVATGRLQIDFRSHQGSRQTPGSILGVPLTSEQKKELSGGSWIFLKGMTSSKGRLFNSYVRWKSQTGKLEFQISTPRDLPSVNMRKPGPSIGNTLRESESPSLPFKE